MPLQLNELVSSCTIEQGRGGAPVVRDQNPAPYGVESKRLDTELLIPQVCDESTGPGVEDPKPWTPFIPFRTVATDEHEEILAIGSHEAPSS